MVRSRPTILTIASIAVAFISSVCFVDLASAVGNFEVERVYYTCPEDAESLAECTEEGTSFKPCTGTIIIEGSLVGNYRVSHSERCDGGGGISSCGWGYDCTLVWDATRQIYVWDCDDWAPATCL